MRNLAPSKLRPFKVTVIANRNAKWKFPSNLRLFCYSSHLKPWVMIFWLFLLFLMEWERRKRGCGVEITGGGKGVIKELITFINAVFYTILLLYLTSMLHFSCSLLLSLHRKWRFLLKISSVNVTKSAGNCRFSRIYWKNP